MISATAKDVIIIFPINLALFDFIVLAQIVTPGVEKKNVEKGFRFLFGFPQVLGKH